MPYLDFNASAPLRPKALRAMQQAATASANPSSLHQLGRDARLAVEQAQTSALQLVGADPGQYRCILTSSGTEADAIMLDAFVRQQHRKTGANRILISAIEHPAVVQTAQRLVEDGLQVTNIPVNRAGQVDVEQLETLLANDVALVATMLAHNETGIIQPIGSVVEVAAKHNVPVHVDAVQACGKYPIHWTDLGAFSLAFSAHKFGGPRGIGGLIVPKDAALASLYEGGGQQEGVRSGTEPMILCAGLAAAAREAQTQLKESHTGQMRDLLEAELEGLGAKIVGKGAERLDNTCLAILDFGPAHSLVDRFDEHGLRISAGAACHAGTVQPSATLLAMGYTADEAASAVRFSVGYTTTAEDVHEAVRIVAKVRRASECD